jgi:hypothetical protein
MSDSESAFVPSAAAPVSEYGGVVGQLVHRDDSDLCEAILMYLVFIFNR